MPGRRPSRDRLDELQPVEKPDPVEVQPDVLEDLRRRLDAGLTDRERQQVVQLLVKKIVIYTDLLEDGKTRARAAVHYRFPECVVPTGTGRGTWPPRPRDVPVTYGSRADPPFASNLSNRQATDGPRKQSLSGVVAQARVAFDHPVG